MGTRKYGIEKGVEDDAVMIAVMGMTGSGKSSFIAAIADQEVEVAHSLVSSTNEIKTYTFRNDHGRRGYIIDTPGFDDTNRSDAEVLIDITLCFNTLYSKGILLNGLIYLHRITDVRMQGSALKNLTLFRKLCGRRAFPNVMLVTTMWDALPPGREGLEIGDQRLEALTNDEKYFGEMDRYGATLAKHFGTAKSARVILNYLIDKKTKIVLEIQDQMVNRRLDLNETSTGIYLQQSLLDSSRKYDVELDEVRESIKLAQQDRDEETVELLRTEEVRYQTRLQNARDDQKKLRTNYEALAKETPREYEDLIEVMQRERTRHARQMAYAQALLRSRDREIKDLTEETEYLEYDLRGKGFELDVALRQLKAKSLEGRRDTQSWENDRVSTNPPDLHHPPLLRRAPTAPQHSSISGADRSVVRRKKSF